MLWPQDMPTFTLVVLSTMDDLVPFQLVRTQIKAAERPIKLVEHPTAGHGGFLVDWAFQDRIANLTAVLAKGRRRSMFE